MSLSDMLDAIYTGNLEELRTLLSLQKCSDTLRDTLLHEAVVFNKKAITKFLLQAGSNPNSAVYSSTPLHIAARNGNLGIIQILHNHGADRITKDSYMIALKNEEDDLTQLLLERGARPLHVAVKRGSLKLTKMLLQNGAPVNLVIASGSEKGYTPLHCACSSSRANIDIIEFLLSNEAGVNLKTEDGLTCLHIASQVGNVRVINLLLNYNADINARDKNSYAPLYLALDCKKEDAALLLIKKGAKVDDEFCNRDTILGLAIRRRFSSTVEEILTRCLDPQGEIAKCKESFRDLPEEMINILLKYCFYIEFFHTAIRKGYIQIIESVLKDRLDLTANFDVIRSSVHIAVKSGQIKSVQVLIAHGADVNGKDETGMTPLLYAIQDLNVEMTKLLISHGADVKIADDAFGKTALHIAASQGPKINRGLHYALEIAKMLLASGADVNAATTTEKLTPLHVACQNAGSDLVKLFLKHNADVNLKDKNGKTAIRICVKKNEKLIKLLFEHKANVNSQDIDGCTALHKVFSSMRPGIVKLLIKFGADIDIKDRNDHTPMDTALYLLCDGLYDDSTLEIIRHALALEAINLFVINDLQTSLIWLNLQSTDKLDMGSHLKNWDQEIEKLKSVKVPGYNLTYYTLMTRSIHYVASYVKDEDLITHFQSDYFTTKFPIYASIIQGRLRNAFQRRPLIGDANEFFRHHFQLPHVCIDHILSCLSSNDLQNLKDAM